MSLRQRVRARSVPATSDAHNASSAHRRRVDRRWRILRIGAILLLIAAGVFSRVATGDVAAPAPVVQSSLGGLACPLPGQCVSVGTTGSRDTVLTPYAVWFANDTWTLESPVPPLQNGDSILSAVSCPSGTHCVAVGRQDVPAPYFGAKSAGGRPLIEVWTGHAWRSQRSPVPGGTTEAQLNGVACVSSSACVAVGSTGGKSGNDRVLTQFWDGKTWTLVVPPRPRVMEDPTLYDIACTSATECTAVGHFTYDVGEFFSTLIAPLILRWNGDEWRFENSDNVGDSLDTELGGIACPSTQRCIAVGSQRHSGGAFTTFAEIRDGARWHLLRTPDPKGTPYAELKDVACPSPQRCIAVGSYAVGSDSRALIESWDGADWTIVDVPSPPGASSSVLRTIACEAPDRCLAAGSYRSNSPTEQAYSALWDGASWTVVPMPVSMATG